MRAARYLAVISVALTGAGCNDCDFWAYCEGNTRVVCGDGVDQQVGREVRRFPCADPNPICVASGRQALCVRSLEPRCQPSFDRRCEGSVEVRCEGASGGPQSDGGASGGYDVVYDCSKVIDPHDPDGGSPHYTCRAPSGCVRL
jgi:hypothetical protein